MKYAVLNYQRLDQTQPNVTHNVNIEKILNTALDEVERTDLDRVFLFTNAETNLYVVDNSVTRISDLIYRMEDVWEELEKTDLVFTEFFIVEFESYEEAYKTLLEWRSEEVADGLTYSAETIGA